MANITTTETILNTDWTQVGDANEQILISVGLKKDQAVFFLHSTTKPSSTLVSGHKVSMEDAMANAYLGSAFTDAIWARTTVESATAYITVQTEVTASV